MGQTYKVTMKTKLTALLLAVVAAFALVPQSARAGDKEAALIGGLIGGLIIGSALSDASPTHYPDATVVVTGFGYDHGPSGYWDHRTVRVWVPGSWEFRWVHGCRERVFVPGYWTHRQERVWVAHRGPRGHDHRGYDRHDGYGRGDRHDRYDRRDRRW
jgi:hypothetical protein